MRKGFFLIIFLVVAICLGISIGTSTIYASAEESTKPLEGVAKYYYNVNKSIEIYDEAMKSFRNKKSVSGNNEITVYQNAVYGQ